jgi:hypothetical protein
VRNVCRLRTAALKDNSESAADCFASWASVASKDMLFLDLGLREPELSQH